MTDRLTNEEALAAYDKAAKEFIAKVERGDARSQRTYAELRRVLNREAK